MSGTGTTLNFSSSGIQFTTESQLPVGRNIEFSVNWPVELDGACALKFVARGVVVRSAVDYAAVRIYNHEFRTRRKAGLPEEAAPPSRPISDERAGA